MSLFKKSLILVFLLLIVDQTIKIWVKSTMFHGDHVLIFNMEWAQIHFIENPGMAFGFLFGGKQGKMVLSIFRLIAIAALLWYLYRIAKDKYPGITIVCVSLILTGAVGNILDSAFYGLIFDSGTSWDPELQTWIAYHGISQMNFEGYAGFLGGSVVDMFYFPMLDGTFPTWFPDWSWWPMKAGQNFTFFSPVFNFADSMIFIGVVLIIFFRKKFIKKA